MFQKWWSWLKFNLTLTAREGVQTLERLVGQSCKRLAHGSW